MSPYYYKRNGRNWVMFSFTACKIVCLILAGVQSRWRSFGSAPNILHSFLGFGLFMAISGTAVLVENRESSLRIDEATLGWTDGDDGGQIAIKDISEVQVEYGDGRLLIIVFQNGCWTPIPGDCYGDADELRQWFSHNLGRQLEVVNIPGGLRLTRANKC